MTYRILIPEQVERSGRQPAGGVKDKVKKEVEHKKRGRPKKEKKKSCFGQAGRVSGHASPRPTWGAPEGEGDEEPDRRASLNVRKLGDKQRAYPINDKGKNMGGRADRKKRR